MMAKVYMDLTHPEELKELLQQAKDNNVKSVILDAYEWQLANTGLPQEQMNDAIDKFRKEYLSKLEAGKTIFTGEDFRSLRNICMPTLVNFTGGAGRFS